MMIATGIILVNGIGSLNLCMSCHQSLADVESVGQRRQLLFLGIACFLSFRLFYENGKFAVTLTYSLNSWFYQVDPAPSFIVLSVD